MAVGGGSGSLIESVVFWLATLLLVWVYAGYPVVAAIAGHVRPFRIDRNDARRWIVTIGIAAHDEADQLEPRVANILQQAGRFDLEVIVASDGSTDASIAILERLAASDPRVRYLDLDRVGQTAAQREIFEEARGEIVVLSDAETRFAPDCIANLIAPFADPRVGCTTGRLAWIDLDLTETSHNEGVYWRYEQLVRRLESRAGWLTAVTGALLAVRRERYRPVPSQASMDHLLPLYARADGLTVLAVQDALASDRPISGLRAQFRNRSRTATRGIRANLSMAGRLTPWRHPSAWLAIWSHKLLRWATPLFGTTLVVAAAVAAAAGSIVYLVPIAFALAILFLGLTGLVLRWSGRRAHWASLPLAVLVVNAAFVVGWINVLRGRRIGAWHRTDWAAQPRKS
jgi:cellulose synthase/poly-beta-1,6-N-acetylglucosamine synthase-like glycosyltransferase